MVEKMNFQEFCLYVKEHIKEYLPDEYKNVEVSVVDSQKNNGTMLHGIMITAENCNIAPVLYMDGIYNQYCKGEDVNIILQKLAVTYVHEMMNEKVWCDRDLAERLVVFEKAKNSIYYTLINAELNAELLKKCPHRIIGGLAVIYKLLVGETERGNCVMVITNEHMENFETDEETLFSLAQVNTPLLFPVELSSMENVIKSLRMRLSDEMKDELLETEQEYTGMFVLTNQQYNGGASVMLYPNVLKTLEKLLGEFCIIPSSIHEVLVFPVSVGMDMDYMKFMVKSVNDTNVLPEEVLSNHIFRPAEDGFFEVAETGFGVPSGKACMREGY